MSLTAIFQLTSSQGGWQWNLIQIHQIKFFNSHPHKEDDFYTGSDFNTFSFSTHILTRRMTFGSKLESAKRFFSTHILTRRMTDQIRIWPINLIFQLTSSQGGWRAFAHCNPPFQYFSTHILTRRMTIVSSSGFTSSSFQLTSSQGGWRNSSCIFGIRYIFSTHILTRRMTKVIFIYNFLSVFSTHILTRRMTLSASSIILLAIFQLTSSQGGWRVVCCFIFLPISFSTHILTRRMTKTYGYGSGGNGIFNSHPHKEDDYRFYFLSCIRGFSTHILTRRMTIGTGYSLSYLTFQLTSSQGGWHNGCRLYLAGMLFNSHPHKEDDSNFKQKHSV